MKKEESSSDSGLYEIKWQVASDVLSSKVNEEVVLMSIKADAYFGIDPVGSDIWDLLAKQSSTVSELAQSLVNEYDIDLETCTKDVQTFIDDMAAKQLIHPAE